MHGQPAGDPWADGYPWAELLAAIEARPPNGRPQFVGTGDTRRVTVETRQGGSHTLLSFHRPQLGKAVTEWRPDGIQLNQYPDDQGPTDVSHLIHLEADVFALVRETGGPSRMDIGSYLGIVAGLDFGLRLIPIARTNSREVLRAASQATSIDVTVAASEVNNISAGNSIGKALRAIESEITCDEIRLQLKVRRPKKAAGQWWTRNRRTLEDLVESGDIERFTAAKAGATDLLESVVTAGAYLHASTGVVDASVIVSEVLQAYAEKRSEVRSALGR